MRRARPDNKDPRCWLPLRLNVGRLGLTHEARHGMCRYSKYGEECRPRSTISFQAILRVSPGVATRIAAALGMYGSKIQKSQYCYGRRNSSISAIVVSVVRCRWATMPRSFAAWTWPSVSSMKIALVGFTSSLSSAR